MSFPPLAPRAAPGGTRFTTRRGQSIAVASGELRRDAVRVSGDEHHVLRARPQDLDELATLVEQYWAFEGIHGFDRSVVSRQLSFVLQEPRWGDAWVAKRRGVVSGYLLAVYVFSLEHLGLTAEIDELFVRAEDRGAGVGALLLHTAEAAFLAHGYRNVSLQLGRTNDQARRFYGRHGYQPRSGFKLLEKSLPAA